MKRKPAVEIRCPEGPGIIDEIVAKNCNLHIEQMSGDNWFLGIDGPDGSYWQFWIGARNRKSAVDVRHYETVTPEENRELRRLSRQAIRNR